MEYIQLEPPTWESAVRIYTAVLKNPEAGQKAHQAATDDLLNLARAVDRCRLVPK
jgi:hypothetical protein